MISGYEVFKLMDTYGLPLDIIVMELREKKMGFNVVEFIEAAKKAGWKSSRVRWTLLSTGNKGGDDKVIEAIDFIYR